MIEPLDGGLERPRRGERADVQLVDHRGGQRPACQRSSVQAKAP